MPLKHTAEICCEVQRDEKFDKQCDRSRFPLFVEEKSWLECVEFLLDHLDLIRFHRDELIEVQRLAEETLEMLNEFTEHFDQKSEVQWNELRETMENFNGKVHLTIDSTEHSGQSAETEFDGLIEKIHRTFENLLSKRNSSNDEEIFLENQRKNLENLIETMKKLSERMNELNERVATCNLVEINQELVENSLVRLELDRERTNLSQIDRKTREELQEKFLQLDAFFSTIKEENQSRQEFLQSILSSAEGFWRSFEFFSEFLNRVDENLSKIDLKHSTSGESLQILRNELIRENVDFEDFLDRQFSDLISLIEKNSKQKEEIHRCVDELSKRWKQIDENLKTAQDKTVKFNVLTNEVERVVNWFEDVSLAEINNVMERNDNFDFLRTFKENLSWKYLDLVHLRQDFCDLDENQLNENQWTNVDSKWNHLNDQIQEQ